MKDFFMALCSRYVEISFLGVSLLVVYNVATCVGTAHLHLEMVPTIFALPSFHNGLLCVQDTFCIKNSRICCCGTCSAHLGNPWFHDATCDIVGPTWDEGCSKNLLD